jgi:peptidoglycan biosynthesis protein MviN/MurJ (putative lipid II flippase)
MLWLINRLASWKGHRLGLTALKAIGASLMMGASLWLLLPFLQQWLPGESLLPKAILVGVLIGLGSGVYLGMLFFFKVPELRLLTHLFQRFLPGA